MAEGWFKDQQQSDQPAKVGRPKSNEPEYIGDEISLEYALKEQKQKVKILTDESYNVIMPLAEELFGDQESATALGQVGEIRNKLRNSPLLRTSIGTTTVNMLKNIENLKAWQTRYALQLEEYIDSFKFLCESAMGIIMNKNKEIEELKLERRRIAEQYNYLPKPYPPHQMPPPNMQPPMGNIPINRSRPIEINRESEEPPVDEIEYSEEQILNTIPPIRRQQLDKVLEACQKPIDYIWLCNPQKTGKNYQAIEIAYFKLYQKRTNLWKRLAQRKLDNLQPNLTTGKEPNFDGKIPEKSSEKGHINMPLSHNSGGLSQNDGDAQ